MPTIPSTEALARLKEILDTDGVRAALIFLNTLTPHRFTAMYRFDNEMLRNIYFVDRDNPDVDSSPEIPVTASYCVFVRESGHTFLIADSLRDERANGHPKQRQVQSYCGVPLVDKYGKLFGTICHFDFDPISISQENVHLMEDVAPLLKACMK